MYDSFKWSLARESTLSYDNRLNHFVLLSVVELKH